MFFSYTCFNKDCGEDDLEVEIIVDSYGEPSSWDYPGSGPVWHMKDDIQCSTCGHTVTEEEFNKKYDEEIQQRLFENTYDDD
jgi:hypothetical protein